MVCDLVKKKGADVKLMAIQCQKHTLSSIVDGGCLKAFSLILIKKTY